MRHVDSCQKRRYRDLHAAGNIARQLGTEQMGNEGQAHLKAGDMMDNEDAVAGRRLKS